MIRLQSTWYANPDFWAYGGTTVFFGLFAVLLSLRWRGELRSSMLLSAVVLSALWAASATAFALTPTPLIWRTAVTFDLLRLVCLLVFLQLLLRGKVALSGRRRNVAYPALVALLSGAGLLAGYPPPEVSVAGEALGALSFGLWLGLAVLGLAAVEQLYRRTPEVLRWNVRPLCIALGGLFGFDLVVFADALLLGMLDDGLWTARSLAQSLVIPLLGLAAARNREWTFDVTLSRGMLMGSTAVFAAAVYLLVIATVGYNVRFFGGQWGTTLAAVIVFGALLAFTFVAASSTLRSKLRVLVAKNFLAYRYDYREEWLKFTRVISTPESGSSLHARCLLALGDLVETSSGSLWQRQKGGFVQVERLGHAAVADIEREDADLPAFLRATGWVIDIDEARRNPAKYRGVQLPQWLLQAPAAWLVVPLLMGEELIGFVVLGRPRVSLKLDWEVLDLLKTAGRQAASYLAQEQATEALLEARKFESFNRMSAFVVHDLKNLVAQLHLMLRNAERHSANPDFQQDMLATVGHVVGRMNQLMMQLRLGERPVDRPHPVDLAEVVARVQRVRASGRSGLVVDAVAGVLAVAHDDRLERVIGHLVQNAFDAVAATPRVNVRVYRAGDDAVIEVQDNGPGMSAQFIRDRLFKPFSSTKQTGMGIGTYESQQYVTSIGGRIEVESRLDAGTKFRVILRAADPRGVDTEVPA